MDHSRVDIRNTGMSCGVVELARLDDDLEGVLYALGSRLYHPSRGDPCAFFVASDLASYDGTNTSRLCNLVIDLALGRITTSVPAENPKTGNFIRVYVWEINHENFKKWYASMRAEKLSKVGT